MRNSSVQGYLRFPLTSILGSSGNVRVLRPLIAVGAPLTVSQLVGDAGMTPQGLRHVLDGLVSQGLVKVIGQPRSQVFDFAREHPLAPALRALFVEERKHWDRVHVEMREILNANKRVHSAWIYGSVAREEDGPGSDLDIALVLQSATPEEIDALREALQAVGDRLHFHPSVVVLTPAELVDLDPADRWWVDVQRDAKILKGISPQEEFWRWARAVTKP